MVSGKSKVEIIIAAKDRTKAAFAKVNTQMKTMKGGAGRLGGAMNTLKGGLGNVTSSLGSFGAALGPVGIAVAGAAVVMATLGGAAFKAALEFEKASATIRVGTGATGEALTGLEDSFKTVFTEVPTTTADAATAIADLNTRLGLTGEPLEALATQFLNLSRITGTDVAASISSATRVMHDFDVSAKDQAGALDYLFKVSQSTGLGMTQLGNSMTQYGSVMRQMGFDINESAALLGKFEKEGVNLQLVLGSLRMGLAQFAKAGEEPVAALERVIVEIQGMGSVADANLKAIEIFGSRAGPDMAAAIREGRFEISEMLATLDASGETINKAAEDTLQFGDKWTLLKNNVMEAIAPIGDIIMNVLGNAIEGLSASFNMLQAVIAPVMGLFKTFFDAINSAISSALAPLIERLAELQQKFKEGSERLTIFSDIFTIISAAAKWLGEAICKLVSMALAPLVAKLKEGIDMLASFYDKLGPLKGALEWIVGGLHNLAESLRDTTSEMKTSMDAVDEMAASLEDLEASAVSAPTAILKAWKLAVDAFEEGAGSFKDAISEIDKEIEKLKDLWKRASEEEKGFIEDSIRYLSDKKKALEEEDRIAIEYLDNFINGTEKAIEKTKEFTVSIGDTTLSFKGAAAEVVKNADAYEKLQKSAQTLIDLDWAVFTEFKASLPNIEAGLGNMESGFVGFKSILEDNIEALENIKQSVKDIYMIAAPFSGSGFQTNLTAIREFASTLKDASTALNDFSSLQDISIEGCINFSLHVHDMVRALEILESQMEDLVPSFGEMGSAIASITQDFTLNSLHLEENSAFTKNLKRTWDEYVISGGGTLEYIHSMTDALMALGYSSEEASSLVKYSGNAYTDFTVTIGHAIGEAKTYDEFIQNLTQDQSFLSFVFHGTTHALEEQTGELKKITDALKPYLDFMRTLNELAALSTLSTEELNKGLNSIKDTLINLGTALSSFDLRSAMEGLFAPDTGSAKGFMDVMSDYNTDFLLFASTLTRITEVIGILSVAMENAAGMVVTSSKEMEAAMRLIPAQLEEIETFLRTDLWGQIVAMLFAVNVEWKKFEDILETTSFSKVVSTLSNLIGLMNSMKDTFSDTGKQVVISAYEMEKAVALIPTQLEEIEKFLMDDLWGRMVAMIFAVNVQWEKWAFAIEDTDFTKVTSVLSSLIGLMDSMKAAFVAVCEQVVISSGEIELAMSKVDDQLEELETYLMSASWDKIATMIFAVGVEWQKDAEIMDDSLPSFNAAVDTISSLASKVLSLSTSLSDLRDMTVLSVRDIDEALKNIPVFLDRFVDALALNMGAIKDKLKELHVEWGKHAEEMKVVMPSYEESTASIGKLVGSLLSLHSALESLSEMGTISEREFGRGFKSLMESITNFATSFSKNAPALIESLWSLERVWLANQSVIAPLMENFLKISANFIMVANNANAMTDAFRDIEKNSGTLEKGFKSLIDFINQVVKATKEFYTREAADELASFITDVGKVIDAFYDLEIKLKDAMGKIKTAIKSAVDNIETKILSISGINESMYINGGNTLQSYINGLKDKESALETEMWHITDIVQGYLATYSNAKLGPLSHLDEWAPNLMQSYSCGIEAEMHTLNSSFAGLAPGMGAGGAGGNKNVTFYVTQHISDRATADYANRDLERLMHKHAVM